MNIYSTFPRQYIQNPPDERIFIALSTTNQTHKPIFSNPRVEQVHHIHHTNQILTQIPTLRPPRNDHLPPTSSLPPSQVQTKLSNLTTPMHPPQTQFTHHPLTSVSENVDPNSPANITIGFVDIKSRTTIICDVVSLCGA
jgi:hypothetical protein